MCLPWIILAFQLLRVGSKCIGKAFFLQQLKITESELPGNHIHEMQECKRLKTIVDKLMYVTNDDTQKIPSVDKNLWLKHLNTQFNFFV